MLKADGSISIHADDRAYKPLNWMNPPCTIAMGDDEWVVTNAKGERLTITIESVHADVAHTLGAEPGLAKDGVEAELQGLLAAHPAEMEMGLTLIGREWETGIGPVDLLCRDAEGATVAVEVKRRGEIDGVEQLSRYLGFLERDRRLAPVRGLFVAERIAPQARTYAASLGIGCVTVDYERLAGLTSHELRLF